MIGQSFDARIVNGQLVPSEGLRAFEGRHVHVTLSQPIPNVAANEQSLDAEPQEGFDVERDVSVRIPLTSEAIVNPVVTRGSGLKPCLILPEDAHDE